MRILSFLLWPPWWTLILVEPCDKISSFLSSFWSRCFITATEEKRSSIQLKSRDSCHLIQCVKDGYTCYMLMLGTITHGLSTQGVCNHMLLLVNLQLNSPKPCQGAREGSVCGTAIHSWTGFSIYYHWKVEKSCWTELVLFSERNWRKQWWHAAL